MSNPKCSNCGCFISPHITDAGTLTLICWRCELVWLPQELGYLPIDTKVKAIRKPKTPDPLKFPNA